MYQANNNFSLWHLIRLLSNTNSYIAYINKVWMVGSVEFNIVAEVRRWPKFEPALG